MGLWMLKMMQIEAKKLELGLGVHFKLVIIGHQFLK
jgi:hypothetical protein